jgi:hypothetical protein
MMAMAPLEGKHMNALNSSVDATAPGLNSKPDQGLGPYLIVGLCWFFFAVLTLSVRLPTPLWSPVFDWVFSQAVLTEQLIPNLSRFQTYAIWLAAYLLIGTAAWAALEWFRRPGHTHRWRRAIIAWLAIQVVSWAVLAILVAKGVVAE